MPLSNITKWVQQTDTRWQRRIHPGRCVLVNARTAMNSAVIVPIYRAMQDSRVTFFFTASEQPSAAKTIYGEIGGNVNLVSPARAALMKFSAYLVADMLWVTLPRGTRRIQMFHGVAGKYSRVYDTPDRSMRDWDRLFFINRRRMENYIRVGAIDADSPAARLVGYPKLDCLVDGSLSRDDVLDELGIDPARRTVLYAPTWSPYSSLNVMGEALVQKLVAAGYAVIVKLHDRSRDLQYKHSGGIDWAARLEPILRRGGGWLADGSDACPYLAAADVLITDHSSVGFEYLLLDRPVVRIDIPELIARTDINPEYVDLLREASITVRDVGETIAAVERCFGDSYSQSASRRAVASELFYEPGMATARAVRELYDVIELDPPSEVAPARLT
ncbi:MAG TPA: CDP-glycerol glycerophosphotransferase family protein [Blastocatellia bacterium]|nr:CDP-glycerol glycerophosphotransferase family protein [Blastocatellia bacterium]